MSNCREILNWKIYFLPLHASYLFSERCIKCQFEIRQMWMDSSSLRGLYAAEPCVRTNMFEP